MSYSLSAKIAYDGTDIALCKAACDQQSNCNSFTACQGGWVDGCYLKVRVVDETTATRSDWWKNYCKTWYKATDQGAPLSLEDFAKMKAERNAKMETRSESKSANSKRKDERKSQKDERDGKQQDKEESDRKGARESRTDIRKKAKADRAAAKTERENRKADRD